MKTVEAFFDKHLGNPGESKESGGERAAARKP
jgi:hypothetical protein